MSRVLAYARGALNRIHGLLTSGRRAISDVINLIRGGPINLELTEWEAGEMIEEITAAQQAADRWKLGESITSINPPSIPTPPTGAIDGGDDGEYEFGGVIQVPDDTSKSMPVFGSVHKETEFEKLLNDLEDYAQENADRERYAFVDDIINALLYDPKNALVPLWLYRRVSE